MTSRVRNGAMLTATAKELVWLVPASALLSFGYGWASVIGSGTTQLQYALLYVLAGSVTGLVAVPLFVLPTLVFLVLRRRIGPSSRLSTAAVASAVIGSITFAVPLAITALTRQEPPIEVTLAVMLWAFGTPLIYGLILPELERHAPGAEPS